MFSKVKLKFKDVNLELSIIYIVKQASDVRYASHKVNEIGRLIFEQGWKLTHGNQINANSAITYIYNCNCYCDFMLLLLQVFML